MHKDMFYFSDVQYRHVYKNMEDFEEKDIVLVSCQQMLETFLLGLKQERFGEVTITHDLNTLVADLGLSITPNEESMLTELTDIFNNRYGGGKYVDYNFDDYKSIVKSSLDFLDKLSELRKSSGVKNLTKFGGD